MPAESDENDILASCGAALVPYLTTAASAGPRHVVRGKRDGRTGRNGIL